MTIVIVENQAGLIGPPHAPVAVPRRVDTSRS
ncbi:hypothetical protein HD597_002927 [Nonomuraea thailandensis]|uniref:Uncharacterized protein n=1 Tax=Nonomuraea thailandensis TaxID=1188745 RepID=A0A9X2GBG7_9ACTN|nr:hypothetical protein [Nonomuraea thailandensis]